MVRQPVRGLLRPVVAGGGWAVAGYGLVVRPWRPSPHRIVPELQHLADGDVLRTAKQAGFAVTDLAAGHHWVGLIDGELGRLSFMRKGMLGIKSRAEADARRPDGGSPGWTD